MQTIINLGTGGADLNGQNGSTTSADSNDALFLDWPGDNGGNYVYLPGASDNLLTIPDEAALDITGDIDIRAYVALDDWTVVAGSTILAKYGTSGNRSWLLDFLNASGTPRFVWSADGTNLNTVNATAAFSSSDGEPLWVRVTFDVDNGSSENEVKFWQSDDGASWTQVGATITTAGVASLYDTSADVSVGARGPGGNTVAGKYYRAQVLDGIDGTTVLDVDTSVISSGSVTSFTALTGQTVTINRSVNTTTAKSVAVTHPTWLFAVDDYMTFPYAGRQMASATESMTAFLFLRRWPYPVANNPERIFNTQQNAIGAVWSGVALGSRNDTTQVSSIVRDDDADSVTSQGSSSDLHTDGTLDIFGAVLDRATNTWRTYVNGTEVLSGDASSIDAITPIYDLTVGRPSAGAASYMEAEVFGGAVWDRALTPAEITAMTTYYQNKVA